MRYKYATLFQEDADGNTLSRIRDWIDIDEFTLVNLCEDVYTMSQLRDLMTIKEVRKGYMIANMGGTGNLKIVIPETDFFFNSRLLISDDMSWDIVDMYMNNTNRTITKLITAHFKQLLK